MLIKALCEYADFLEETIPEGWGYQDVSYMIMLSLEGDVTNIIDIREDKEEIGKNGKVKLIKIKKKILLPFRHNKSAIYSEIIEHRGKYIFGLQYDNKKLNSCDKKGKPYKDYIEAFKKKNMDFFEDISSEIVTAYKNYIKKWNNEQELNNELLLGLKNSLNSDGFCFALSGHPEIQLEKDEEFIKKYSQYIKAEFDNASVDENDYEFCGITGIKSKISETHDIIKFPVGNAPTYRMVSMKTDAFHSYGKKSSFNSGISETAMKKYTSTLNKLLSDKNHRIILGDLVLVFFAMKSDDSAECDLFSMMLGETREQQAAKTESGIHDVMKNAFGGVSGDAEAVMQKACDNDVTFYVAGLTANSSRICQKFIFRDKFGAVVGNLKKHQKDMHICNNSRPVYFSGIEKQLISPKATDQVLPPPLMTSIIMAALGGGKYPFGLLETVVRRVKTDSDEEGKNYIKLNDTRAGIIKACLNRKYGKEEITVALNEQNHDPAYLCGRLFAVLEKIQQESVDGTLNRTITDAYFSSAAARPSVILPKLIQLSKNHLRKLSEGRTVQFEKITGDIINALAGEFPRTLDLDGQGRFIVGFYQQKQAFFQKKTDDGKDG
ncbi:MAG: type I-C CRISPR-associated protein Cas8c/Csd1 [Ruminococcus sp.]|uniref:type I-C CRISPR-associated protein Cas8c/Csd1 n=1 Tax=Ruminococcus sp. TaxID=41978 RepID=UPI0025CE8511|nr:type I-C CRISPR-associated protein Cas8c/Csd1 [Ruminococcus sp.]MCR5540874.1 type I-C CRISPR-associated protein Cas8c/Csd1 [Ruminococcus sp.]